MTKSITIIAVCLLTCISIANAQDKLQIDLVRKINQEVLDFTTDNMGNLYLLTPTNQVKKVNREGDSIAVYNDVRRYGKIYSIDATNPLKVLVFYKDFSTVVVLDRLLNVRATVDLRKQNIFQARAIATSYDNQIWLFDELESRLKKIDENGQILLQSADFRQVFDSVPSPHVMFDRDGFLYLYDELQGLFVFDYYGAKRNNYRLLHLFDLQVIDKNTITARDAKFIYLYKPASLQLLSFIAFTDQSAFKKINFNSNLLYCLTKTGELQIYKVLK